MAKHKPRGTVYLIHFATKLAHAQHYIGYTADDTTEARIEAHRKSKGARLLAVCNERGIKWDVVRVWLDRGRKYERSLKNRGGARRICPTCNPRAMECAKP